MLTAIVIVSMPPMPLGVFALRWLMPEDEQPMDGVEAARGPAAGAALIHGNVRKPTPFTASKRAAEPSSEETAAIAEGPQTG